MLTIANLVNDLNRPAPFTLGAELWNDPHISGEMLKAHLAPDTDAASYKPDTIASICRHLPQAMGLQIGAAIVDLGCGPGFYCRELSKEGYRMTGIDRSGNSLKYARGICSNENATFNEASYVEPFGIGIFQAALLISQDYGVLKPNDRKSLLNNIHQALTPGGWFALDVPSQYAFSQRQKGTSSRWSAEEKGFWRPHPYITLEKTHFYPEQSVLCDLVAVLDEDVSIYRIWQTYYSPESISKELQEGGFAVRAVWGNLKGDLLTEDSQAIGILCQKA